ncbi:MAG TPA: PAS domain S-box protein, partial [Polyangia bacterium]|nr:PAS domain S-box protein [Polyangia bacterium]
TTTAAAIHALSPAQAAAARPVRVRAVVTHVNEDGLYLFIQDASDGVFVDASDAPSPPARPGDLALVEGVTAPGLFAPQIRLRRLTVVGTAPLPPARPSTYAELASGKLDSRLVTLEGTVRAIGVEPPRADKQYRLVVSLAAGGGTFEVRVHLANPTGMRTEGLVDATVALTGVCGGIFNGQRQLIGVVLHAPDASAIVVRQPAPTPDPFAQGPRAIQSLFQFAPNSRESHRVRVDGTVTYRQPGGALYIWDGTAGMLVQTTQPDTLVVGDEIEAVGFPVMGEWTPVLADAIFRRARAGTPPPPVATTAEREAGPDGHDARLVTLEATMLDAVEHGRALTLALMADNVVFNAEVPAPRTEGRLELERRSRLRLTGISVARADNVLKRPIGFKLLLRSTADLKIVSRPPWWTLGRLLTGLAALAAACALVVFWVVVLRRRVREQTEIIRAQIQREAMLEDRYRDLFENANDIVFSQDRSGRLTAINRAAEEISGYRRAELLTRSLLDFLAPERRDEALRLFDRLLGGEEPPARFQTTLVARDGRRVALEMAVRPTVLRGAVTGIDGIARDVSARERAAAELAAANARLVEVSRHAGMAEVASGVLHNVGNVLNSVNVSTALLAERLRGSRVDTLARAVALLRARAQGTPGQLAAFLADEPEGQRLVAYLDGVAAHLRGERDELAAEVASLVRSVDHIKQIVVVQQGYARAPGGTEETLPASALVGEALRLLDAPPGLAPVEIAREVAGGDDPPLTVEKHKVVQILLNLVRNARQACLEHDGAPGLVVVRVERAAASRVHFSVRDNGVGIAPEVLARVFEHGFTTRKDGHGFGLHGAALMAAELGGALAVASEGPGKGAIFTLDLPLVAARAAAPRERMKVAG